MQNKIIEEFEKEFNKTKDSEILKSDMDKFFKLNAVVKEDYDLGDMHEFCKHRCYGAAVPYLETKFCSILGEEWSKENNSLKYHIKYRPWVITYIAEIILENKRLNARKEFKYWFEQAIQSAKKEAVEECIKKIDDYGLDTVDRVIEFLKNY